MVKISQLVAMGSVVKTVAKIYAGDAVKSAMETTDGKFETSHAISVVIADAIKKVTPKMLKAKQSGLKHASAFLESQLESISDSKLTAEQLSKLPKEAVLTYSLYLTYLSHLQDVIKSWSIFLENFDNSWATPEAVHDQWLTLVHLDEQSRALRLVLYKASGISAKEADALLQKQVKAHLENVMGKLQHKPKLEAAQVDLKKSEAT